jgi:large subunit ribosomal protein L32
MPVPKRKRSKSRRDKRFANKGLKETAVGHCQQCQNPLVGHQACSHCGFYKGVKVLRTKADRGLERKKHQKEKKAQEQETEGKE